MSSRTGQMKLGAHFPSMGQHIAAWLHPEAQVDAGQNFPYFVRLAQAAERAKFDFVFMADAVATRDGNMEALSRWPQYMAHFEPITLLSATASVTERIGLVCTASTSYYEPFNVARLFGSLDHISGGRAGWNVVTSANPSSSFNFNRDAHYDLVERYQRAREFVQVVLDLWDSWEDDVFLRDRVSQRYFDPKKLHQLNHKGKFFSVRGPLNLARPPQGYPVIAQAGASEDGRELGAETAEVIFFSQQRLEAAQNFYRDVKGRMAKFGRSPDQLKILAGLNPTVARTESEAKEKFEYMQSLIHPDVGKELLSVELGGIDLSDLSVDEPIPPDRIPEKTKVSMSRLRNMGETSPNANTSRFGSFTNAMRVHGDPTRWSARRLRLPITWKRGSKAMVLTASLSKLPTCPAASMILPPWWCRNCSIEDFSEPNTRAGCCASTWGYSGRQIGMQLSGRTTDNVVVLKLMTRQDRRL